MHHGKAGERTAGVPAHNNLTVVNPKCLRYRGARECDCPKLAAFVAISVAIANASAGIADDLIVVVYASCIDESVSSRWRNTFEMAPNQFEPVIPSKRSISTNN